MLFLNALALLAEIALLVTLIVAIIMLGRIYHQQGGITVSMSTLRHTITVTGRGEVHIVPDEVHLQVGVRVTTAAAREARDQAAEVMSKMMAALKSNGIQERAIKTGYFAVNPEYRHSNEEMPRRVGYTITNTADITITAVETVGAVLDAVMEAGEEVIVINSIQFTTADPSQAQGQAQRLALGDARRQAEQIAQEMGITLGKPLTITPNSVGRPIGQPRPMMAMSANIGRAQMATPMEAGELDIVMQMEVVYAIEA